MVVRHSWQLGVAFFVARSYKDLQSVIMSPGCSLSKAVSGACHLKLGFLIKPHIHLIQVNLSREVDMAYASALKVERTTLPTYFECHTMGENSVVSFTASLGEQDMMNNPC